MAQQSLKKVEASAADTAKAAADLGERGYSELTDQLAELKADLAELSAAVVKAGQNSASDAVDGARKAGRKVAATASDKAGQAADQVELALHEAESFASKRPAIALGIAAGVGALLALAMTRR